jgi:hypothetical protein
VVSPISRLFFKLIEIYMAINKSKRKMSIGLIVRDNKGEVLATLSSPKDNIIEPVAAEAHDGVEGFCLC